MRRNLAVIVGCLALMTVLAPRAHAFTSQPDSGAAITGGAPLADPDDKVKTMFGGSSGGSGTLRPGIGSQGTFQPGTVPGFGSGGATYDRGGSGKDD